MDDIPNAPSAFVCNETIYPFKRGGLGFLNAPNRHNHEVCSLREYFLNIDVDMHKNVVTVDKGLTPFSLVKENWRRPVVLTTSDRMAMWKSKELLGKFHKALVGPDMHIASSLF